MQKDKELYSNININKLVDLIPGGIAILDLDEDLTIQYANAGYYQLFGLTPEEFGQKYGRKSIMTLHSQNLGTTLESLYGQLSERNQFYLEVELKHKNNEMTAVGFYGMLIQKSKGWDQIYCVLVRLFQQEQEVNRIIQSLSNDILFDMMISEVSSDRFEQLLDRCQVILPEDRGEVEHLVTMIRRGRHDKAEFRAINIEDEVSVYQVLYDFIEDDNHNPWRAVGKIMDVTEKKKLEARAVCDPLTRLYNKVEIRNQIDVFLNVIQKEHKQGCLLILDIDNFKSVNDWMGHHYGDTVLVQLAVVMRNQLPDNAMIGRIGGDEFIAFMPGIAEEEEAASLALRLREVFSTYYKAIQADLRISCSIGISFYPKDGDNFEKLYQRADSALYEAKNQGKDCYCMFREMK